MHKMSRDGSLIELDDHLDLDEPHNNGNAATELVAYDPAFAKPYYVMSPTEKKAWRRGNRKKFLGAGYALTTVGGGTFFGGIAMMNGATLAHTIVGIVGFEIMTTAFFMVAAAVAFLLMLLPWEDA